MSKRGFTITELIIVITIMTILLVLGVVNMSASQANGRDQERKTDVETISLNLETYYMSGTDGSTTFGTYPATTITASQSSMTTALRDIDIKSLEAPGITDPTQTFVAASNNNQTTGGVTPQPSKDQYVYQPLQSDGSLCTQSNQECRKYNLFYKLEVANISSDCPDPGYICKYTSKRQ